MQKAVRQAQDLQRPRGRGQWDILNGRHSLSKAQEVQGVSLGPGSSPGCGAVIGYLMEAGSCWLMKVIVFQLLSHARLFATPQTAARQAPLSFTLQEFVQSQVH